MGNDDAVELARELIVEVHQAAGACGVEIPTEIIEKNIEVTRVMVPYDSSMRLDFLAGRPMEIDAIFGAPIRHAAAAGFEMPRVDTVRRQLQFLQQSR